MKHGRLFNQFLIGAALPLCLQTAGAWAQSEEAGSFEPEERSTIDTIPFDSLENEDMAATVIEGGLEPTAAGQEPRRPSGPGEEILPYADPLALTPEDSKTDLGRHEIPVDIRFENPASIPGQTRTYQYNITPPGNRTYNTFNTSTTPR